MQEYITEIIVAGIVAAISTAVTVYVKHRAEAKIAKEKTKVEQERVKAEEQRKEYEKLLKEEQTRTYRNMIIDELEPIVEELVRIKETINKKVSDLEQYIKNDEQEFENIINEVLDQHNMDKEEFEHKIQNVEKEQADKISKILESYKFRFIQLCKIHLRAGYITNNEWEQIVAFFDLYRSLGGNGQAENYYEKVKALELIKDEDAPKRQ